MTAGNGHQACDSKIVQPPISPQGWCPLLAKKGLGPPHIAWYLVSGLLGWRRL